MKFYFLLSIFFIGFITSINAQQQNHFVFIQSDNKQPFNVIVEKKVYSSTVSGYVIIPKLSEGTYNIKVGFAPGTFPDQSFNIVIDKKDLGYSLKNFTDKGWGLFNLQNFGITYSGAPALDAAAVEAPKPVVKKQEEAITFNRPASVPAEASKSVIVDTLSMTKEQNNASRDESSGRVVVDSVKKGNAPTTPSIETNSASQVPFKPITPIDVKKVSEEKGEDGVQLTYVDSGGIKTDTVQVIIPSTGKKAKKATEKITEEKVAAKTREEIKFIEPEQPKATKAESTPSGDKQAVTVLNCKDVAAEDDYARLRRKMARETSDERMIAEASKAFKGKCFSTSQVQALSTLFLSDEGRFNFFNAMYILVSDPQSYSLLEKEFIDPTFTNRFRSMLKS